MRIVCLVALACTLAWRAPQGATTHATPVCRPMAQAILALPGRVDSLLAAGVAGDVMALVGQPGSRVRFLPHDALDIVDIGSPTLTTRTIAIPPYLMAPGLAASTDGADLYALVNSTVFTLDGATGRLLARQDLRMQAIGWPAAVATGTNGDLYLVGQPASSWVAQAYAFKPDRHQVLRQRWRAPLGLTHAGTWIGLAGNDQVAVYVPDQSDMQGTVALLDRSHGTQRHSFAVRMAPTAADATRDRLFLAGAGTIRALALHSGAPVAAVSGDAPLAVSSALGLVAFLRANHLVVARGDNLRTVLPVAFPGGLPPTALAWQGTNLLVGSEQGITRIRLGGCLT